MALGNRNHLATFFFALAIVFFVFLVFAAALYNATGTKPHEQRSASDIGILRMFSVLDDDHDEELYIHTDIRYALTLIGVPCLLILCGLLIRRRQPRHDSIPLPPNTTEAKWDLLTAAMVLPRALWRGFKIGAMIGVIGPCILLLIVPAVSSHNDLARLTLPGDRTIVIRAEPAFDYEPPGYIYCKIRDKHGVIVPERRFMGVGPERTPTGAFAAVSTSNQRLMAITLNGDVQFLYDFETGQSWPGLYTTIDNENYAFAIHALDGFRIDGKVLTCSRLRDYERRQRERGGAMQH